MVRPPRHEPHPDLFRTLSEKSALLYAVAARKSGTPSACAAQDDPSAVRFPYHSPAPGMRMHSVCCVTLRSWALREYLSVTGVWPMGGNKMCPALSIRLLIPIT